MVNSQWHAHAHDVLFVFCSVGTDVFDSLSKHENKVVIAGISSSMSIVRVVRLHLSLEMAVAGFRHLSLLYVLWG